MEIEINDGEIGHREGSRRAEVGWRRKIDCGIFVGICRKEAGNEFISYWMANMTEEELKIEQSKSEFCLPPPFPSWQIWTAIVPVQKEAP